MKALLLVDLQNDFMPWGTLPISQADQVVEVANQLMPHFQLVVASQDWHPANHKSFASQHPGKKIGDIADVDGLAQILWPDHCIQNSQGAQLVQNLNTDRINHIVYKGTDTRIDSYSAFSDNAYRRLTELADYLQSNHVDEIYIMGLATDYCVLFTALDALKLNLKTHVIIDGCRGVGLKPTDIEDSFLEMQSLGANLVTSSMLL